MKKDKLEELFDRLKDTFDTEEPRAGHEQRFLERLKGTKSERAIGPKLEKTYRLENVTAKDKKVRHNNRSWWKPLAIAASIALLCALGVGLYNPEPTMDQKMAEISPEASRSQLYFAGLIEEQVKELEGKSTPETKKIIADTMEQLDQLEADYSRLERDLVSGGNSKLILSAMITNFQTRIDLLQEVMDRIDSLKNINTYHDETTTI